MLDFDNQLLRRFLLDQKTPENVIELYLLIALVALTAFCINLVQLMQLVQLNNIL